MSFYPKDPACIGVDSSSVQSFKVAHLNKTRKGWKISQLKEISKQGNVNPLYSSPKDGLVITAIPSRDVLVRNMEIAAKKEKDALLAVPFQIEPHLPFPLEGALLSSQVLEQKESTTSLTTLIVKKDHLQKHLSSLPFIPEKVTSVPCALASFAAFISKATTPQLWVHIGEEDVTVALVQTGKLLAARAFDKSLDIVKEIQKTLLRLSTTHKNKTCEVIYLLGQDGSINHLLQQETGKTVLFPGAPDLPFSQEELVRFGLAIGIALSPAGPDFRQKEFSYPHPYKRYKKPLVFSFLLAAILFGTILGGYQISLSKQKERIRNSYTDLLQLEGKKPQFLPETSESYFHELAKLEKDIASRPDTYPLYPQTPRVKEFLAWISSLPELTGKQKAAIDIQSLHYVMAARPEFSRKNEHYKIRVDLEFTAENPNAARAFHDALLSPQSFVDTKEEFKWNVSKGKYRAEFFLKDKTRYQ